MNENQRKQLLMDKCYKKGFNDCKKEIKELLKDFKCDKNDTFVFDSNQIKEIIKKRFGEMK